MQKNDLNVGKIVKVSGPLIVAENMGDSKMYDVVRVSDKKLIGEIIELRGDKASIQVYEETSDWAPAKTYIQPAILCRSNSRPDLSKVFTTVFNARLKNLKRLRATVFQGVSISPLSTTIKNGVSCRRKKQATKCRRATLSAP